MLIEQRGDDLGGRAIKKVARSVSRADRLAFSRFAVGLYTLRVDFLFVAEMAFLLEDAQQWPETAE